jgi:hypothetical protein
MGPWQFYYFWIHSIHSRIDGHQSESLRSDPQWTEGLAMCIDRALDKAVWLHVAMYGYTTWTWYVYLSN